jgi:hypothetical protein
MMGQCGLWFSDLTLSGNEIGLTNQLAEKPLTLRIKTEVFEKGQV